MTETVVFVARIPSCEMNDALYPLERQAEIDRLTNEKVKREKYFVWKLLECAIDRMLGEPMENFRFERLPSRKWIADKFCFSLSHSDGVIAVALSCGQVGVDVEKIRPHREGLERNILTERELSELSVEDPQKMWERVIDLWTKKESIFKSGDGDIFEPTRIEVSEYPVRTQLLEFDGEKYMLSVCAYDAKDAKFEVYEF